MCEIHDVVVDYYRRFRRNRNSVHRRTTNGGDRSEGISKIMNENTESQKPVDV